MRGGGSVEDSEEKASCLWVCVGLWVSNTTGVPRTFP